MRVAWFGCTSSSWAAAGSVPAWASGWSDQGHSVAIIDRNAKAFRRLPADWPGTTVVGSGFDRDDLDRAGAGEADALAAVTSGDNSNILTARIARETYEIPNVVARIYDPRRAQIYLRLGIPTVATVSWTIDQVRRRLVPGEVEAEWSDPTGTLSLVERELPERWAGKRLADLSVPGEVTVVAVTRAGVARLDFGDLVGQDGDVLHLMVTDTAPSSGSTPGSSAATARPSADGPRADDRCTGRAAMKVAIAGAGSVGTAIAADLHAGGHDVLVIEQDPDLVARIRGRPRHHLGGGRRLRGLLARRRRPGHRRRGGGGHRRRRGQPGRLPAGQAGVRRAPGGGPGQPPEEPVAVQRELGRRRVGVDPPAAHRPGRGGGVGRAAWSGCSASRAATPTWSR